MPAAVGIVTSAQPPTAVVNIQGGMAVQPVVLVDQNGNYVTPGGSQTTAGSLATTTVPVNVAAATAPTANQVLTATSGTTATWQALPTGTTGAKGVLQLDGTATDINPPGSQAAGAAGQPADAKHVHPWRDSYLAITGTLGETLPRYVQMNSPVNLASGTLMMQALFLQSGAVVGHLATCTGSTAINGPTHWWFALYDNNLNLLAVTADQTSTAWAANTYKSLAVATIASGASTTFTTTYTGLYYFGVAATWSSAGPNIMAAIQSGTGLIGQAPAITGASDTGLTTPSGFPHTATAITPQQNLIWGAAMVLRGIPREFRGDRRGALSGIRGMREARSGPTPERALEPSARTAQ